MTLDEFISQDNNILYFRKAIKTNYLSHAYIINGEKGTGKKSFVNSLILELFCTSDKKPCMNCHFCKMIIAGNNTDIIYIKHEKENTISVEEVRKQLSDTIYLKPQSSKYKIYIIDEAHKLSVEAQNAILKTIEEPPTYAIIFLITENMDILLKTIKSRAIKINMNILKKEKIYEYLVDKLEIDKMNAEFISSYARGKLGFAIELAKFKEDTIIKENIKILKNIKYAKTLENIEYAKILKSRDKKLKEFIEFARLWYEDILFIKIGNIKERLNFINEYEIIKKLSKDYSLSSINKVLYNLDKTMDRINSNVGIELNIMFLLNGLKGE